MISGTFSPRYFHEHLLGASELSGNLYCNSRISVLGRLRDYLRLLALLLNQYAVRQYRSLL